MLISGFVVILGLPAIFCSDEIFWSIFPFALIIWIAWTFLWGACFQDPERLKRIVFALTHEPEEYIKKYGHSPIL